MLASKTPLTAMISPSPASSTSSLFNPLYPNTAVILDFVPSCLTNATFWFFFTVPLCILPIAIFPTYSLLSNVVTNIWNGPSISPFGGSTWSTIVLNSGSISSLVSSTLNLANPSLADA